MKSGTPAAASAAWITWAVSASARTLSVPIVSKSHWTNSRNRPFAGRSPRKTEPIAYRLNGVPSSSMCLATKRARGTVKSKRKASSPGVPPLLVTSKICRSTSSEPAPLPVKTSIRSMWGVSIGRNPKLGEDLAEQSEHSLAGDHHRGSQVSQAAGDSGVDHGRLSVREVRRHVQASRPRGILAAASAERSA